MPIDPWRLTTQLQGWKREALKPEGLSKVCPRFHPLQAIVRRCATDAMTHFPRRWMRRANVDAANLQFVQHLHQSLACWVWQCLASDQITKVCQRHRRKIRTRTVGKSNPYRHAAAPITEGMGILEVHDGAVDLTWAHVDRVAPAPIGGTDRPIAAAAAGFRSMS
jgi:hypothetical protein